MQDPVGGRDGGDKDAEEFSKSDAHRGNRARLDDQEQSPAVEKSPERPQRFPQVNVLPARPRHHRRQFAIAERGYDGHETGYKPGADQQRGGPDFAPNLGRHDEDAGTDHGTDHQHGRTGQAQSLD